MCCAGIDSHEGIDVLKNAGIALLICFTILATFIGVINTLYRTKICERNTDDKRDQNLKAKTEAEAEALRKRSRPEL